MARPYPSWVYIAFYSSRSIALGDDMGQRNVDGVKFP
jgi:hypothetical protein